MTTIVNGWNVCVEKVGHKIYSQLPINKLWIPDDVFWVVKDYLYISRLEIKRKFYKFAINSSTLRMSIMNPRFLSNSLGLPRLVYWMCLPTDDSKKGQCLQSLTCIDYGEPLKLYTNLNYDDPKHLENNKGSNAIAEDNLPVELMPEDNFTVESNPISSQGQSKHSAQWSIVSNDNQHNQHNQHNQDFDGWDNDGQDFGYDSDWYAESRDV
jgi:hypothetical protein